MSPVRTAVLEAAGWVWATARPSAPPVDPDVRLSYAEREALVATEADWGTYIPNERNTALLPGWSVADLTPVYPAPGQTWITLTEGSVYEDVIFWCEVRMPRGDDGTGPTLRNYAIAGQDPDTIGSAWKTDNRDEQSKLYEYAEDSQCIRAYDDDVLQWHCEDGLHDPGLWFTDLAPGGARTGNMAYKLRSSLGVRGGSGTLKRVQFRNSQDHVSINQPSAGGASDPSFMHVLGCLLDPTLHYSGADHWQAEGTHDDNIQFHRGKNIKILGNRITRAGRNSGVMLIQEVSAAANDLIEFVEIKRNVIEGASGLSEYGINHGVKHTNDYSSTVIEDNDFLERADGKYIIRPTAYAGSYGTNHTAVWDVEGVSLTRTGTVTPATGAAP